MRKHQEKIKPDTTYGNIKVLKTSDDARKPKRWDCICLNCNLKFSATGQNVLKYKDKGCPNCIKAKKDAERVEEAKTYIGKQFGSLLIIDFAGLEKLYKDFTPVMLCKCMKCNRETKIPLVRLKAEQAKECDQCTDKKNLKTGQEKLKTGCIDGTNIYSLKPDRKINSNSQTGVRGVSTYKYGYRAYINFKRKQYGLGTYATLEDAAKAREEAENRIYGDFLQWYHDTHEQ